MSFIKVANQSDVPPGCVKAFQVNGKKLLIAHVEDEFYAMENRCPHIGKPLENGTLDSCTLTCPYHHAKFELRTGKCVTDAKILFVNMSCQNAKIFAVRLDGDGILVDQPAI